MNSFIPIANFHSNVVSFQKPELTIILSLYGRMVASGEWRDYGISSLKEVAVFSIFRRTAEHPIYRIEKRPEIAKSARSICGCWHGWTNSKTWSRPQISVRNSRT